ncbi:MAG: hypothetical protein LUH03_04765 [Oscillospiraceae bacterium]|nr:hypothetical protein [Oscillospiraceae bacterium]
MQSINETCIPGISLSKKYGKIVVFRSTMQALSEPRYIKFLINMEKGCLAIQACEKKILDSFRVPIFDSKETEFRIYSDRLLGMLWKRYGWDSGYTYHMDGALYPEHGIVEFNLNEAVQLADIEP